MFPNASPRASIAAVDRNRSPGSATVRGYPSMGRAVRAVMPADPRLGGSGQSRASAKHRNCKANSQHNPCAKTASASELKG